MTLTGKNEKEIATYHENLSQIQKLRPRKKFINYCEEGQDADSFGIMNVPDLDGQKVAKFLGFWIDESVCRTFNEKG